MKIDLKMEVNRRPAGDRDERLLERNALGDWRLFCFSPRVRFGAVHAFSLLEVMIAMALFFTAIFAILSLTSQSLAAARHLQVSHVDVSGLAGMLALTNRIEEGPLPREIVARFEDFNPGYSCEGYITEAWTNGLFRVDLEIVGLKGKKVVGSTMSILLYRPESATSSRNRLRR
ncbi:MAG: hypothetical protein HY735_05135 [Verrucomicrobia bacterium]|nr:hypothetical protein [Verrucomicrobiota bacterium]